MKDNPIGFYTRQRVSAESNRNKDQTFSKKMLRCDVERCLACLMAQKANAADRALARGTYLQTGNRGRISPHSSISAAWGPPPLSRAEIRDGGQRTLRQSPRHALCFRGNTMKRPIMRLATDGGIWSQRTFATIFGINRRSMPRDMATVPCQILDWDALPVPGLRGY